MVELNRAVAVGDGLRARGRPGARRRAASTSRRCDGYHLLPSVRGDLLAKLGRYDEARAEFERAASLTRNAREREVLLARAGSLGVVTDRSMNASRGERLRGAARVQTGPHRLSRVRSWAASGASRSAASGWPDDLTAEQRAAEEPSSPVTISSDSSTDFLGDLNLRLSAARARWPHAASRPGSRSRMIAPAASISSAA